MNALKTLLPAALLCALAFASPVQAAPHEIVCFTSANTLGFPSGCVYTDQQKDVSVRYIDTHPTVQTCMPTEMCPMYARSILQTDAHTDLTVIGAWTYVPDATGCHPGAVVCICTACIDWADVCMLQCGPCLLCTFCIEGADGGCMALPPVTVPTLPTIPDQPNYVATALAIADMDQDGGYDGLGVQVQGNWYVVALPCDVFVQHGITETCTVPL